ncbi:ATP-dependent helicase [Chitinophaga silvatica]|uniref:ATP-dependent helicase n=1 Tax=Chitinophaga silvatica TaxID=2282649 RepID=A0A3E1Y6F6_9BACT|nr:DEAD/DEAH box helicase [Chitinophaga silvatica]RFS20491.1 ATP-dependent helicase [Chitinophaga silvatica]
MVNEQYYRQQYKELSIEMKYIVDVLSFYLHPLEHHIIIDALKKLTPLQDADIAALVKILIAKKLVVKQVTGTYSVPPALNFLIFPEVVSNPDYSFLTQLTRGINPIFFQVNIRAQEFQQLLTAYFTGSRSLLLLPVKKLEQELSSYLPAISYLLYFPVYTDLLNYFSQESMDKLVEYALNDQLLKLAPLQELSIFADQYSYAYPLIPLLQGTLTTGSDSFYWKGVEGLYSGKIEEAQSFFNKGLKAQRQLDKKNTLPASSVWAFYYAYLLTQLSGKEITALVEKLTTSYDRKSIPDFIPAICLLHLHAGRKEKAENQLLLILERNDSPLLSLLAILSLKLFHPRSKLLKQFYPLIGQLLSESVAAKYNLLAYELLGLYQEENYMGYETLFHQLNKQIGTPSLFLQSAPAPEWERLLNILLETEQNNNKAKTPEATRIIYLLDFNHYTIQPIIQSYQGNSWSNGRNLALKKLKEGKMQGMTDQDFRIANTIQKDHYYNNDGEHYSFSERVWQEIAGHPFLFADDASTNVEVIIGKPELSINTNSYGYTFSANLQDFSSNTVFVRESETRLKVIQLTPQQRKLLQTLDQIAYVPETGKTKLTEVIKSLGTHLTIHADIGELNADLMKVTADARIVVQLVPLGEGLKGAFYVKPFNAEPPYCKPGKGALHVIGISKGIKVQTTRNLEEEQRLFHSFLSLIEGIVSSEFTEDAIIFEDPLDCLELLEIIQQNPDIVRAEWPEGERYKVTKSAGFMHLRMSIQEKHHWFQCEGELKVDEDTVLSLQSLLDTTRTSKKRFIELQGGAYLALNSDLRKRLNELAIASVFDHGKINIQPFALPLLDELLEKAGSVTTDKGFDKFVHKRAAALMEQATVPVALQTTLRPYQEEGFHWMTRLAAWGAGACLADDMGLGKTIQAIALLLHRAEDGAALIICPASVIPNWISEINKFAPTLTVVSLAQGDRAAIIKNAGPFTVVLTTYGVLQTSDELPATKWHTIVLDEAHTIKNFQTKTARAALKLQGTFRLMLTGTPIQNHTLELWSLFNFLNPGLLGSLEHFNKQFVFPAVRNPAAEIKQHLRKLVSPFLLRRTKTSVLDELPPKTEITKLIRLSPSEKAFYEALRRTALEHIKTQEGKHGQQHIRALAEITRLRLAACNPALVDTETDILSSKLSAFQEIVEELIANNHRALVFSQFVQHLGLVKQALDRLGIEYLYLDGSTTIKQREQRVKEFQAGKGALFLISLKAGGQGLNLTAADYVIQLDPWWNPAIEDQAADRAYRIGQTRPVTVYRLVAEQTIEEKIIQLHHLKKELAEQLLTGSEAAGSLTTEDLLDLLSEG